MEGDDKEGKRRNCRSNSPGKIPTGPPSPVNGHNGGEQRFFSRRQRERNHSAAFRARRQMVEHLLPLMRGQSVLHKRIDLIRVGMRAELKCFVHSGSGAAAESP
jgi:hypothetical protein